MKNVCTFRVVFFFTLFLSLPGYAGGGSEPEPQSPTPASAPNLPPQWAQEFTTDFSQTLVDFGEIVFGGPSKDGIPALDKPRFESPTEASGWLKPREPVMVVSLEEGTKVYPLQILMWHEIVNDTLGTQPIAVTWCPLCNTGVVFSRRLPGGEVVDFGTTGRLRFSNLIMYDRQSESWWQQAEGRGIIGRYAGTQLGLVGSLTLPWNQAMEAFPEAQVLSRITGFPRSYGANPYQGYDTAATPFLYQGPEFDTTRPAMERALVLFIDDHPLSLAYSLIEEKKVIQVETSSGPLVVLWTDDVLSPLSAGRIAQGTISGSANAFWSRSRGGTILTLDTTLRDEETGTQWTPSGLGIWGPLAGEKLEAFPGIQHFWFSASAFGSLMIQDLPKGEFP
ncbi:MAG: DUF3179 domain-containing protein [Spirochaetales bacterium]|nr:DUF3179 domain-containing protein [Spirochaetales bacterium]